MNLFELFKKISVLVFDVDGVLTDGSLLVLPGGVMARRMNIKDGYALQLAVKKGYHVVVISGGDSPEVIERLYKLGVTAVFTKVTDKVEVLNVYLSKNNLSWSEVLYMGDDIPDLNVMQLAALACCPSDAVSEIKQVSGYISHLNGGTGCVREIIEKVMRIKGDWMHDTGIRSK